MFMNRDQHPCTALHHFPGQILRHADFLPLQDIRLQRTAGETDIRVFIAPLLPDVCFGIFLIAVEKLAIIF